MRLRHSIRAVLAALREDGRLSMSDSKFDERKHKRAVQTCMNLGWVRVAGTISTPIGLRYETRRVLRLSELGERELNKDDAERVTP